MRRATKGVLALLLLAAAGCQKPPVTRVKVFAAASLKEVLGDIAAESANRGVAPVQFQFDASSTLSRQIQEGASADVFITAAPEWLDPLKTTERFDWLSNALVLVVPRDAKDPDLKALESLSLANEQVPVGKYGKAALAFLKAPIPARTIYGSNVQGLPGRSAGGDRLCNRRRHRPWRPDRASVPAGKPSEDPLLRGAPDEGRQGVL